MRLIDDQKPGANATALELEAQPVETLGGQIEEAYRVIQDALAHLLLLGCGLGAVETGCGEPAGLCGFNLVLHK
jgi:hypothetical protein